VRDEGPGIPQEQQRRLFERFGRLSNPVGVGQHAKPSGTGLGLFLSKHLVELQGGRIWVESEEGHGTTFFFTLPLADQLGTDSSVPS
jgi:signal transduction histidine kinase